MPIAPVNGRHATAIVVAVCVAITLAPLAAQAGGPGARTTKVKGTVNIGNFPKTQNVNGSVNVGNLPATQNVGGTVDVGNLPSTQNVSGTVTAIPGLPGTPFTEWNSSSSNSVSIDVPAGHHLLIQSVSVEVASSTGSYERAQLQFTTGGASSSIFVPLTFAMTDVSLDWYDAAIPVTFDADPSTSITLYNYSPNGTPAVTYLEISGYETSS